MNDSVDAASVSDSVGTANQMPTRRTLIAGAAWSMPVIAGMTATPAFAASSSGLEALQLSQIHPWDLNVGGQGGPIGLNLQIAYHSSSKRYPDVISFAWTLTVSGPNGTHTVKSGADSIPRYGTWQRNNVYYPDSSSNLPEGTYQFTFTVTVSGSGSKNSTGKIKIKV